MRRWVEAFPPTAKGEMLEERKAEARQLLMEDADGLERARRTLGSLSHFMKHLRNTPQPHACLSLLNSCFNLFYSALSVRSTTALVRFHYNDFATLCRCVPARDSVTPRGTACSSTRSPLGTRRLRPCRHDHASRLGWRPR